MIKVTVRMYGIFKQYGNKKEYRFEFRDGSTFEDLVLEMADLLGESFKKEVYEEIGENKNLHKLVFINNQNLFMTGGMERILKDGDHIMFLPPMAGG